MASLWTQSSCSTVLIAILIITLASPAHAFGAGYVAQGSSQQGTNYRHGDILMNVYFLKHVHLTIVRQIYFGNWLRDFSQLIDRKAIELVPEPILRAVVAIFAHLQFGYSTKEFEVTPERLGCYRPEEHIDNPSGYEGDPSGPYSQLRPQVLPEELAVHKVTAMKNYVASPDFAGIKDTSLDYIEKQLVAAISCGRARDHEAYTHLGGALHTLEDFIAHSNWLELCMQMIGSQMAKGIIEPAAMTNVFAFTGGAARVRTKRGLAAPLVTGTFGALDLYQTLLGEVGDKVSALTLPGLQMRMKGPQDGISSLSKGLLTLMSGIGGNDFGDLITSISKPATQQPADWGKLNEAPQMLWEQLQPIFRVRDKIVRWVYDHLMVDAVANAIAKISTALDKLIYMAIGLILSPVLKDVSNALSRQAEQLLIKDQHVRLRKGEQSIFDDHSTATDPTHSQLCKDHYDHDLNELAGRVATVITTFTIKKVVELWQPSSLIEVRPALRAILDTLHHPFNYSKDSEIQSLMVAEVLDWCTTKAKESPKAYRAILTRLDRRHMAARLGEEAKQTAHSHGAASTAADTSSNRASEATVHDREDTAHSDAAGSTVAEAPPNRNGATAVSDQQQTSHSHMPAYTAAYASPNRVGGTTVHDLVTIGPIDRPSSSTRQSSSSSSSSSSSNEEPNPNSRPAVSERISSNIENALKAGTIEGMTLADLDRIKKAMNAPPSSDAPSPIDESLTLLPGKHLLACFDGVDIGEIVATPGMGIVLKDSMIAMRLRDTEMVEREQLAAREKLGALEDRPVKEMLAMLDFGAKTVEEKEREQESRPMEESKTRRLINKLKIEDHGNRLTKVKKNDDRQD